MLRRVRAHVRCATGRAHERARADVLRSVQIATTPDERLRRRDAGHSVCECEGLGVYCAYAEAGVCQRR
jgi:hypothetical protein